MYRELLLGCGSNWKKNTAVPPAWEIRRSLVQTHGTPGDLLRLDMESAGIDQWAWHNLTTLDVNSDHKPHIRFDLGRINGEECNRIPHVDIHGEIFASPDEYYDELHAYEVLEHIGKQGDAWHFFKQFEEFHRILKPDGLFFATCPSWCSPWAWGDPSHTRVITQGTLVFLSQLQYKLQVGKTPMSDFRNIYKADFDVVYVAEDNDSLRFVLMAIKS